MQIRSKRISHVSLILDVEDVPSRMVSLMKSNLFQTVRYYLLIKVLA